jgi:hypothetical protein
VGLTMSEGSVGVFFFNQISSRAHSTQILVAPRPFHPNFGAGQILVPSQQSAALLSNRHLSPSILGDPRGHISSLPSPTSTAQINGFSRSSGT